MKIPILYEDNHLLIVQKPVNLPVQEDASGDPDLLNELKEMIKVRDQKPGNVYLALVHRLDRPVGGAMVFAKTSKAASRLANELRLRRIKRQYLAVIRGHLPKDQGQLTDFLYKDRRRNHSQVVSADHPEAKEARMTYQTLDQTQGLSLVQVALETGRSHQIRVQLEEHGGPIWGDQRYGPEVNRPGQQIALWAYELSLKHPTRKEWITVHSLPPEGEEPWKLFAPTLATLTNQE